LSRRWGDTGRPAHPIVTGRAATALLFFGLFTPAALMLRLLGRDALSLKREPKSRTYWIVRNSTAPGFNGPDKSQF
jgi:hypothetical protein